MATPVASQKVRLGTLVPAPAVEAAPVPCAGGARPVASRRIPVAAPARTAITLTTGLAKAR